MLLKIGKVINKITAIMSIVSYIGVVAIVVLTVADVFMTKVFIKPIVGSYEITEQLLLCTVFASFAYGQTNKSHINMALVISKLPRVMRFVCFTIMSLLSVGIAALVGYAAVLQAMSDYNSGVVTANLFIPTYPFLIVEAVAMFVFAVALLYDTVLSVAAIKSDKYAEIVTSGWSA